MDLELGAKINHTLDEGFPINTLVTSCNATECNAWRDISSCYLRFGIQ